MTYLETLDYLFSQLPMYHRIGASAYKADLTNTIKLCDLLGNPQDHFKSIHIAGTNGKGSVSHMLASVLQEKGLKVGLYTSPHLKDFRERIRINGKMIPKRYVCRFIGDHKKDFEELQLSFFEMTVGLAFRYFNEEKVDIAVVEVGLGGRLDSTNIITPLLSVITNISYDHMQLLGDSLEKIASEKAGIIKPGVPVIIGETQDVVKKIFVEKAKSTGSEIIFADSFFSVISTDEKRTYSQQDIFSPRRREDAKSLSALASLRLRCFRSFDIYKENLPLFNDIVSPLLGNYQKKNIVTIIAACQALEKSGINLDEDQVRRGIRNVIKNTGLKGRWQVLARDPLTICDTGHNEGGLKEVLAQISETPYEHLHFVFGVVNDKEVDHILAMLPKEATYYFCKADIPRGLDQDKIKIKAQSYGLAGLSYPSVTDALKDAKENASANDLVFIGGSTFIVAEVV
jgi:dihydrofolate synthase / folylpolyglutamate synthase